ncbi:hypothetical protein BKN14_04980 [Candidatus Gracilibacteria bacterium HOT-871]|nr:hypothetical protein BKN14_04980 [Candidatus Gracilibacteria bacterium HOT-871]
MENKNGSLLASIAGLMVVFTAINIFATHYLIQQNEYKTYGGESNYKKVLRVNKMQYDQAFASVTEEQLEQQLKDAINQNAQQQEQQKAANGGEVAPQDLKVFTPVSGKADADLSIYEFSDLECPYCVQLHKSGIVKQALEKNKDNVNYVFRNFPLTQIHPGAEPKAQVGLCVYELSNKNTDTYYKFISDVFDLGNQASTEQVVDLGAKNGIDKAKLNECLSSKKYAQTVQDDLNNGINTFHVSGTPTIVVVNNKTGKWQKVEKRSAESIQSTIDSLK